MRLKTSKGATKKSLDEPTPRELANRIENFNYLGINLTIKKRKVVTDEPKDEERINKFIYNLKSILQRFEQKNVGFLLNNLDMYVDMETSNAAGTYTPGADVVTITM
ncbi:MAG: hypothetical protein ACOCT9_01985 [archaeon]